MLWSAPAALGIKSIMNDTQTELTNAVTPTQLASEADFTVRIGDSAADALRVTAFEGTEAISQLFFFTVELCSHDPELDLDALLGQSCTLKLAGACGTTSGRCSAPPAASVGLSRNQLFSQTATGPEQSD